MNFAYRRPVTPDLLRRMQRDSAFILMLWIIAIAYLPPHVFVLWFAVVSAISFVNTVRTLAAHRYEGDGNPLDRSGQLLDSVDIPGRIWTELWAPVGLRYHALHHYFPGIPYHNLAEAHRRLIGALPEECLYGRVRSRSLAASLHALLQRGSQTRG
jgi:fatty acid desaturase